MPTVLIGQRVYVPMNAGGNGGVNYAVAHVTEVTDDDGPHNGAVCNVQIIPNRQLNLLGLTEFNTNVEVLDYEGDARDLGLKGNGTGNGAWLPDWP